MLVLDRAHNRVARIGWSKCRADGGGINKGGPVSKEDLARTPQLRRTFHQCEKLRIINYGVEVLLGVGLDAVRPAHIGEPEQGRDALVRVGAVAERAQLGDYRPGSQEDQIRICRAGA